MENEKEYIITIDGTDCSGKSTLWKKANEYNKNIQVRGILSNIAYGIKYNRNIDEMIDLYNENPVNYVVYLINPINDKKLEMLYNRLREHVNDNDFIEKELADASKTWSDYTYFKQATEILYNKYKGDLVIKTVSDNDFDKFTDFIEEYKIKEIDESLNKGGTKVIKSTVAEFEKEAKKVSEFKYIVFIDRFSKEEAIDNLYEGLDDNYKRMLDKLFEYSDESAEDVYDSLEDITVDSLINYLDDYEFRVEVDVRCEISTSSEVYVPLKNVKYDLEDAIYDDSCLMDDLYDSVKDSVYDEELDIDITNVR